MEMDSGSHERASLFARGWSWFKAFTEKFITKVIDIARLIRKIAKDDPRRVIHSLKVGLALTLVSLFYYLQPLYSNFGVSAMWAVMTVVVVFEYSVGATLGKGLNRGLATLLAGALGVGAHHMASVTGKVGEPILLGIFVFLQAAASTFVRFFPRVKARYDYGLLIFILTFCLVSISGYRTDAILELAQKRFSTIAIGASICVIVSIFLCPVWAGEDLHKLISHNIDKLGNFLEGFGDEYLGRSGIAEAKRNKSSLVAYKSVLDSKNIEEALANLARWEPAHGAFMYRHPWKQYLKIGALTRQCACRIEAINGYLKSEVKASAEIRGIIQETSTKMSMECGKALKELALSIKTMTRLSSAKQHIINAKTAAKTLKALIISDYWEGINLVQVIPVAVVSSILIDVVVCVENIVEAVDELASLANFKSIGQDLAPEKLPEKRCANVKQPSENDHCHVVIQVHGGSAAPANSESQFSVHDNNQL